MQKSDIKLIYSLKIGNNKDRNGEYCGYRNKEELLDSLLLNSRISNKYFNRIELYCDNETVEIIKEDGRDFSHIKIISCLDGLNWVYKHNWSYSKVFVYSLQKEPFIHLDIDAFLFSGINKEFLEKKMLFQIKEDTTTKYQFYKNCYDEAKKLNILPKYINKLERYSFNCAVFGVFDKELLPKLQDYEKSAREYILNMQNVYPDIIHKKEQCVLFEQAFISNFTEKWGLDNNKDIGFILNEDFRPTYENDKFTHLIVGSKREEENTKKIKKLLNYID